MSDKAGETTKETKRTPNPREELVRRLLGELRGEMNDAAPSAALTRVTIATVRELQAFLGPKRIEGLDKHIEFGSATRHMPVAALGLLVEAVERALG